MQITQNFNKQQLIDVGLNLSDYKFRQEHKVWKKTSLFSNSSVSVQVRRNTVIHVEVDQLKKMWWFPILYVALAGWKTNLISHSAVTMFLC